VTTGTTIGEFCPAAFFQFDDDPDEPLLLARASSLGFLKTRKPYHWDTFASPPRAREIRSNSASAATEAPA
jgi:hypothetical protein